MKILTSYSLRNLNTFGVQAVAKYYAEAESSKDIINILLSPFFKNEKKLVLGGGSNILFTQDFNGIVIKPINEGIQMVGQTPKYFYYNVQAGVEWDDFVKFSLKNRLSGIENLSMIPGNVGSSPVQNIGAYGVELKDVFHSLEAVEVETGKIKVFKNTSSLSQ